MEVFRRYRSMLIRKMTPRSKLVRKRPKSSGDLEMFGNSHRQSLLDKRRVTFTDIEELHLRYIQETDISDEGLSTTIGYINSNCAQNLNDSNNNEDDVKESELTGYDNEAISAEIHFENEENSEINPVTTIGKKGKNVGEFEDATHITYLSHGQIIVTDMINNRLQRINKYGETVTVYSGENILEPLSTCLTSEGNIALTSRRRKCVLIISITGELLWSFGSGFFQAPSGVCLDKNGRFIVTDIRSDRVSLHSPDGQFVSYIGNPQIEEQRFYRPRYVCVAPRGEIVVSDSGNHAIKVFDCKGNFIRSIGKFGKGDGSFKTPYGVCTDKFGHIIVADHYNNRISLYTTDGHFLCHVVESEDGIVHPQGLALSPDLNLFVSHGHLKASEIKLFKLRCIDPSEMVYV